MLPRRRTDKFSQDDTWSAWAVPTNWERRSNDRVRVALAVKQRVGELVFLCQASNLSPAGMYLARAHDSLEIEIHVEYAKCWLEFGLPGRDHTIAARGQVVRQMKRGPYELMGVWFTSMAPSHRRLLDDYLHHGPHSDTELQAFEAY